MPGARTRSDLIHPRGACWFSHSPDGRFDLQAPRGTCYLASDAQTAFRERLGPTLAGLSSVEAADVDGVAVSLLTVPRGPDLADTPQCRCGADPWPDREICTSLDYALTRSWAAYFDAHGCGGVRYSARHTLARRTLARSRYPRARRPRMLASAARVSSPNMDGLVAIASINALT